VKPVVGPTHCSPALQPPGESTAPAQEQTRAEVVQPTADPAVVVTCGEQLPPLGAGAAPLPMMNDPPDPQVLVGTLVQVAAGVTVAQMVSAHA